MSIYFELSSREIPLTVDSIGNRWHQDSVKRPNGFPDYHWLQTEAGSGAVMIDGQSIYLAEGCGVLIAPFVPHSYAPCTSDASYAPCGAQWTTSFVTFSGKLENEISKIVGHERYIQTAESDRFSFQGWIDHIISGYEGQTIDPIQLSIDCYTFLISINRFKEDHDFLEHPLYHRYVAPVIKEIETRYQEDITVQQLAGDVFVSAQYLSRLFKRFLGCSTSVYIENYRMVKAKELLVSRPELEVQQIGFRVGYHDASHFIAMFKRITGYTPLEFRRLHR